MRLTVLVAGVVFAALVSCSAETTQANPNFDCLASVSTTTVPVDPLPTQTVEGSALPSLDDPGRYGRGRARIEAIEGYPVGEAEAWALESGWLEVQVVDVDNPIIEPRPAVYISSMIGLCERDGIVLRAWTGGW